MKKIAHCIHHTHWDLIWYFTAQDAMVQFSYNMKEMLQGFKDHIIDDFFMDGQTAPISEYLQLHPEDDVYMKELIRDGKLVIGPFQSQLDCFICNGESVINNLRLGMNTAKNLGRVSRVAYLPDSFGHSYDFPKIFNKFNIHDFVITRGVGDNYDVGSEFYMKSNDGSKLLVCTMIAGYGYGCYAFKEGNLFKETAHDYNKISVQALIERLLKYSTIENEFVFPLGFDQNPALFHIKEKIDQYHQQQEDIEFKQTTWSEYCQHVRKQGKGLKVLQNELFSTQYHRLHKSIFSARADIKAIQDECERVLTYELQPMMSMFDSLGINYDQGLIDKAWDTLLKCQTHSSATLTDETNDFIERESKNALHIANSTKVYLMKLVSISLDKQKNMGLPILICNPLPTNRKMVMEVKVLSKTANFKLMDNHEEVSFSVLRRTKKNHGVLRKSVELIDQDKFYYESDILLQTNEFKGISYKVYQVVEEKSGMKMISQSSRFIENDRYKIYQNEDGIVIHDKYLHKIFEKAIYIEDMGDEGDSFDYSYPTYDYTICDSLEDAKMSCVCSEEMDMMELEGSMMIPSDLKNRKRKICNEEMKYHIVLKLKKDSNRIEVSGEIANNSKQHRVRFIVAGTKENLYSYAGIQFGFIKRDVAQKEMATWRKDKWFEEPSPTFPLLNHVSMCNEDYCTTVHTRSCKEYELTNEGCKDLAITLFRSYGAMAYPDLHRRPGRPSGLDYLVFETPKCQMMKTNTFEIAICYEKAYDANVITNSYIDYASQGLYYQKQDFDKSINPIAYFPTNSLSQILPQTYSFLSLDNFKGNFGSLVKAENSDSYILRLYNSEEREIGSGEFLSDVKFSAISTCDLEEQNLKEKDDMKNNFTAGELRILKLQK